MALANWVAARGAFYGDESALMAAIQELYAEKVRESNPNCRRTHSTRAWLWRKSISTTVFPTRVGSNSCTTRWPNAILPQKLTGWWMKDLDES